MADATQTATSVPTTSIPGTTIPLPVGQGVETLQSINPPFRTNAPAWYTPGVWGQLGCAVPQPGRYLQTNNQVILDLVNVTGRQLFEVFWGFPDRKFERFPSRNVLYEIYQLLVIARKRLADNTVLPNGSPLLPTHAQPAPQMFVVYPIPLYGPLGCQQQWLKKCGNMACLMMTEAMQNSDNELSYYTTKGFFDVVYPYVKYLLVDMATKFFGVPAAQAMDDAYVIPDTAWATYNPAQFSVSVESTSTRPPMGWTPTDLDLEPIRGLSIEAVIPFLQPWPDSQLKYSSGGVWSQAQSPVQPAPAVNPTTVNPSLFTPSGPPSAPAPQS